MLKASKHEANSKMRFLLRVVGDDNVDRLQVYNSDVKPSNTNYPTSFSSKHLIVCCLYGDDEMLSLLPLQKSIMFDVYLYCGKHLGEDLGVFRDMS